MMTTDEMRAKAEELRKMAVDSTSDSGRPARLAALNRSTLWEVGAEICERLGRSDPPSEPPTTKAFDPKDVERAFREDVEAWDL